MHRDRQPNPNPWKPLSRRTTSGLISLLLLGMVLTQGAAADSTSATGGDAAAVIDPGYLHVKALLSQDRKERRAGRDALLELDDLRLAFGVVDAVFFIPRQLRGEALETLRGLTGKDVGRSYWDWVEEMGRLGETVRPAQGYEQWKAILIAQIDPGYREILYPNVPAAIRLEEVVTGGVPIEGIPALDDPVQIPAAEARYLDGDEDVFGVEIDGVAMAYPLRILDWHEMANDRVGEVPISLSYCTLCGTAVLYRTDRDGLPPRRFGTSGLLYRSNKLMLDRETKALWSNIMGEPVVGRLVGSGERLEILPITRTTWEDWRRRHPDTLTVEIDDKLKKLGRKHGFDYRPGRANEARRGVRFPVWKQDDRLESRDEVYVLRVGAAVTAYPLERVFDEVVVHDQVGDTPVVLVADETTGAVRAYQRSAEAQFERGKGRNLDTLVDADEQTWRITDSALVGDSDGVELLRVPGHYALWFGWVAFFPQTEVYAGPVAE